MRRRRFLAFAIAAGLSPRAFAQPAKGSWKVGYISMSSPAGDRHLVAELRRGLLDHGYVEGRNLVLEQRHAMNQIAKVAEFAAELRERDVSVIVIYGSPAIPIVAKSGMPIVMTVHPDPVGSGLVKSLARPGGNITGLTDGHTELGPKRLEIFKEAVPALTRVAGMFNPRTPHGLRQWKLVEAAAPRLGLQTVSIEVHGSAEIEGAVGAAVKARADGLFIVPDPSWSAGHERRTADMAIGNRLPAIGTIREFAERGTLLAFGTNFGELWRRSAWYVDKLLKGARPDELPIAYPTRFDLVINLRTAKAIGVTVPRALLVRADRVVE
jgi:putative ABC transport system substrate-binding protein